MRLKSKVSGENLVICRLESWRTREDLNLRPSASEDYSAFFRHFCKLLILVANPRQHWRCCHFRSLTKSHQKQLNGNVSGEQLVNFSRSASASKSLSQIDFSSYRIKRKFQLDHIKRTTHGQEIHRHR